MASLYEHPTVRAFQEKQKNASSQQDAGPLDAEWLRTLCLQAGADDAGFVEVDRAEIADQREEILALFPATRTLISLVLRMNRENIRSPARSLANLEFHHADRKLEEVAREIVAALEKRGIRALNPAVGFPMEMERYPGKIWTVSHKPVAVAAGLGQMGIHRNVIHPRFGNHILLITILMDMEVSAYNQPISYNPCLECKLCVAACPIGAIGSDGHFNFSACSTHNYREFMGGFNDWIEQVADSENGADYRTKVSSAETASWWQSLSFGANYKAAYCMAVCPAGEDVIGPFLTNRKTYLSEVVKPLQNKKETVYVVPGSDAEAYVAKRFPHKTVRRVHNGLRVLSVRGFLNGLRLTFQREQANNLAATYHFTFTGQEACQATVVIKEKKLQVLDGLQGEADVAIIVDSRTWLAILNKRQHILRAIVSGKLRVKGKIGLLRAFQRCFPA
jgi:Fe-S-cluster-containing hydrogenase component 2